MGSITSKFGPTATNVVKKDPPPSGVHRAFLDDDETPKLKLTKLDSSDDNVPKAIPYNKNVYSKMKPGIRSVKSKVMGPSALIPAKYVLFDDEEKKKPKVENKCTKVEEEKPVVDVCSIPSKTNDPLDDKMEEDTTQEVQKRKSNDIVTEAPIVSDKTESVAREVSETITKKPKLMPPLKKHSQLEMIRSSAAKKVCKIIQEFVSNSFY